MAAAIGIPDEVKGESIALYVVPSPMSSLTTS